MNRSSQAVPAAMLLRRFGWRHLKVACRDQEGHRTALHLRRRTHESVEVELPGGHLALLTNREAGRLRAALREVLLDEHRSHRAGVA
jgi:hypothetical protein